MNDWQPIETAPRDGTSFLAWWPQSDAEYDYNLSGAIITWWKRNYRTDLEYFTFTDEQDDYDLREHPPSHWMPLPEGPK